MYVYVTEAQPCQMTEKVRIHIISDHSGVQGCSVPVEMIQILLFKNQNEYHEEYATT